jgi:hypothetical protein
VGAGGQRWEVHPGRWFMVSYRTPQEPPYKITLQTSMMILTPFNDHLKYDENIYGSNIKNFL